MELESTGIHPPIPDGTKTRTPYRRRKMQTNITKASLQFIWNAPLKTFKKVVVKTSPTYNFLPMLEHSLRREKIISWRCLDNHFFKGLEGRIPYKLQAGLCYIGLHLPPAVWGACFRSIWNGWMDARRFQFHNSSCLMCHSEFGSDSLRHLAHCSTIKNFICCCIKRPLSNHDPSWFLMHRQGNHECVEYLIIALCVHAIFTVHNQIRHGFKFNSLNFNDKLKCLHRVLMQTCIRMRKNVVTKGIVTHLSSISFSAQN
jgi:hypothetical protein